MRTVETIIADRPPTKAIVVKPDPKRPAKLEILVEAMRARGYVATDFGDPADDRPLRVRFSRVDLVGPVAPRALSRFSNDPQRRSVYRAEAGIRRLPDDLQSLEGAERFLIEVITSDWFLARFQSVAVHVRDGQHDTLASATSFYSSAFISLPVWAYRRGVVLHELAHALSDDGHGPRFVRIYIDLVDRWMGAEAADLLREGCAQRGVEIAPRWYPA